MLNSKSCTMHCTARISQTTQFPVRKAPTPSQSKTHQSNGLSLTHYLGKHLYLVFYHLFLLSQSKFMKIYEIKQAIETCIMNVGSEHFK